MPVARSRENASQAFSRSAPGRIVAWSARRIEFGGDSFRPAGRLEFAIGGDGLGCVSAVKVRIWHSAAVQAAPSFFRRWDTAAVPLRNLQPVAASSLPSARQGRQGRIRREAEHRRRMKVMPWLQLRGRKVWLVGAVGEMLANDLAYRRWCCFSRVTRARMLISGSVVVSGLFAAAGAG